MSAQKAKEIILDKVRIEIYLAEQSIAIYLSLSEYSSALNSSKYRELFGIIQMQALSYFVLSFRKLFERPSPKFPNFSIHSALEYLNSDLSKVPVNSGSILKLTDFLTTDENEKIRMMENNDLITQRVIAYFQENCPQVPPRDGYPLDKAYDAFRVLSDKRVAHSEDHNLSGLSKTDMDGARNLIAFAKSFVNIIGYGFFGFSPEGFIDPDIIDFSSFTCSQSIGELIKLIGN